MSRQRTSDEAVLAAVKAVYEQYGRRLSRSEWDRLQLKPCAMVVHRSLGWVAAWQAVGAMDTAVTREELLAVIRGAFAKHGKRLTVREWDQYGYRPHSRVLRTQFGSYARLWTEAMKLNLSPCPKQSALVKRLLAADPAVLERGIRNDRDRYIVERVRAGETWGSIADTLGVSRQYVHQIAVHVYCRANRTERLPAHMARKPNSNSHSVKREQVIKAVEQAQTEGMPTVERVAEILGWGEKRTYTYLRRKGWLIWQPSRTLVQG